MDAIQALALVAAASLALAVVLTLRRTGSLLARTREAEGFRAQVGDLERRAGASLAEIAAAVDGVRRRVVEPASIRDALTAAHDAAERYAEEARSLSGPPDARPAQANLVAELERAARAIELVDHGCAVLESAWRGELGPEAQTSIKRGYLNLVHAREGAARAAAEARRAAESASPARRIGRRAA
jgi:hypothetical protein